MSYAGHHSVDLRDPQSTGVTEEKMDLLHQWQREVPPAQRLTNGAPEVSARALPLVPRLPVLALTLDAAIPWALACSASQAARRGEAEDA